MGNSVQPHHSFKRFLTGFVDQMEKENIYCKKTELFGTNRGPSSNSVNGLSWYTLGTQFISPDTPFRERHTRILFVYAFNIFKVNNLCVFQIH